VKYRIILPRLTKRAGFSLAEVVIALGVIAVGAIAILAVFPTALQTGRSAQSETRAAQIAQMIFGSLVGQAAQAPFNNIQLPLPSPAPSLAIDLTASSSPTTPTLYADNDGQLTTSAGSAAYAITIFTNNSPPGFTDVGYANQVTVRVAWPANASAANQTFHDYVRIVSTY